MTFFFKSVEYMNAVWIVYMTFFFKPVEYMDAVWIVYMTFFFKPVVYMTFTWRSFSNRLNTWMLFGLFNSTMTLWSGKPRLSQIRFTYLSRRFIFDALYGRLRYLLVTEIVCFCIIMMILPLSGSLSWST